MIPVQDKSNTQFPRNIIVLAAKLLNIIILRWIKMICEHP